MDARDRFVIECPQCEARFNLRRYVPDKKVRCRKCRAIIRVPIVEQYLSDDEKKRLVGVIDRPIDPKVQAKVARIFSLRRLALTTLSMMVLLAGGMYVFWLRAQQAPAPPPAKKKDTSPLTTEWLSKNNKRFDHPLWLGYEWTYAIGEKHEERKVVAQSGAAEDHPQFEMAVGHPVSPVRLTLRVENDGVFVIRESRGQDVFTFEPPLPVMRFDGVQLRPGDSWKYEGAYTKAGGGTERWILETHVSTEVIDTAIGKRDCFKVATTGTKGIAKVEETCWYAPGIGMLRRLTMVDGKPEEAKILRYKQ